MGKLLLAALLGGAVAAALTFFVMTSYTAGDRRVEVETRMARAEATSESAAEKSESQARRLELLQRRLDSATREHAMAVARIETAITERSAGPASSDGSAPPPPEAPDGSPYVSRAELETAIAKARASGGIGIQANAKAVEQKSFEEIARDMNLSSAEEASARIILKESEQEVLQCLFGDRPFSEIESEVRAAKDDPEKMEAMIGETMGRAFGNIGKLMTVESRAKKKLGDVLGKDRAKDLMSRPHTPLLGNEFQRLFEDLDLE